MGMYHYWWVIIGVVLKLCFYSSSSQHLTCHPRDLNALRVFIIELDLKPDIWTTFNSSEDCCDWVGITCNSSSSLDLKDPNNTARITKLELVNRGLSGRLSESLGLLDQLRVLNLSNNYIKESIPPSIFNLLNLEALDLSDNFLSGEIPQGLNLPSLEILNLSSNMMSGKLPVYFCHNSTKLKLIRFDENRFSGDIPSGFEKCALLEHLFLGWNYYLTGNIPKDLFQLQSLNLLEIQGNSLSGSLSPALGNLSNLVHLDVSSNILSGEIPDVFNKLLNLKYLKANSNRFIGGFPKSLANSQTLILLNLRDNSLSGPLRLNCAVMTNLVSLDLGSNKFNGSLLEDLAYCRDLNYINLAHNHLNRQVLESFMNFHSLSYLSLSNCSLVNISSTLHTLQHCNNLKTLILSLNFNSEMLPDDLSLHFKNLKVLVIANSGLTGSMPSWLSKSTKLEVLDLSRNSLTGAIPNWIGTFTNLFYLNLSRNSFNGEIPKGVTSLQSLSILNVTAEVDTMFWQYNQFIGLSPTLDLSQNNLSGPIWEEFGNLKNLIGLYLNSNRLSGSIPSSLARIRSLEFLDLSNNRISGSIPQTLVILTSMYFFNVANNSLSGRIPSGGQFSTFPSSSFDGNHFCYEVFQLPCPIDTPDDKQSRSSGGIESDSYFGLDFAYGMALGFVLSFIIVAFRHQLFNL